MARKTRFGKDPMPWRPLPYMEDYLMELEVNEFQPSYIVMVKVGMARFALFCESEGIKHPGEITRSTILHYQRHLMDERLPSGDPLQLSYRQRLLAYVRAYINWMESLGYIDQNPWVNIKVGQVKKKPKPLEDAEIAQLFQTHRSQAFQIPPFFFHRREVILALLYGWGLRIHELAALNVTQMDMRLDYVDAINKGGGTKAMPYSDELKKVVQRWLVVRGKNAKVGEDALLIDQNGERLTTHMMRKIITELGVRAGVKINPHRFRDTFGTTMLDNDVPVERIMKLMGHTRREQTLAYSRVNDHKVKESHEAVMDPKLKELLSERSEDVDPSGSEDGVGLD